MDNLHASARARGRVGYNAQSVASCLAVYDLCVQTDPDFVLDVGTAAGASPARAVCTFWERPLHAAAAQHSPGCDH